MPYLEIPDLALESANPALHDGFPSIQPAGSYVMPPHTETAARKFLANMNKLDPAWKLRERGQFIQTFRLDHGRTVPGRPLIYARGVQPPEIPYLPGTFLVIHSHPNPDAGSCSDFPCGNDYLTAYACRNAVGHNHHMMYDCRGWKFYSYAGGLQPPVFFEARFRGKPR